MTEYHLQDGMPMGLILGYTTIAIKTNTNTVHCYNVILVQESKILHCIDIMSVTWCFDRCTSGDCRSTAIA